MSMYGYMRRRASKLGNPWGDVGQRAERSLGPASLRLSFLVSLCDCGADIVFDMSNYNKSNLIIVWRHKRLWILEYQLYFKSGLMTTNWGSTTLHMPPHVYKFSLGVTIALSWNLYFLVNHFTRFHKSEWFYYDWLYMHFYFNFFTKIRQIQGYIFCKIIWSW